MFGLRAPPPPGATLDHLYDCLDWVAPGFEVVQSHLPEWKFTVADTVADSALHARLLVGANVLEGPLHAPQHFMQELRACPGAPNLQSGDVITTGTWTDAWPVSAGQKWSAQFSAPLSSLKVRFI